MLAPLQMRSLLHNDPQALAIAAAIALGVLVAAFLFRRLALARLTKLAAANHSVIDDVLVHFVGSVRWYGWLAIALGLGVSTLHMSDAAARALRQGFGFVLAFQLGLTLQGVIALVVDAQRKAEGRGGAATTLAAVGALGRLLVWAMVVVLVLSNLGVEVSALAATLGVGGLAAAFAVQNVLGDLFASLSIYLDRPFDLGDAIQVDELSGVVESISWRSTRVRSVSGEQIVFANGELGKARIRNFGRLSERRVLLGFRVPLDTPIDALEALPKELAALVKQREHTRFERAHVIDVGESALTLEVVFWVTNTDFAQMLDLKQSVILGVRRKLDEKGIPLATPTRTYVERVRGKKAEKTDTGS